LLHALFQELGALAAGLGVEVLSVLVYSNNFQNTPVKL
jgi:hypothetical protein